MTLFCLVSLLILLIANTFDLAVCMESGHAVARMYFLIYVYGLVFKRLENYP